MGGLHASIVLTNERDSGGSVPGRDVNTAEKMRGKRMKEKSRKGDGAEDDPRATPI